VRPLDGVKVLDFTHGVAGPFATMLLGDLGADVVKIEKPGRGDASRYMNVSDRFRADIPRVGGDYYLAINRNKRGVTLDLGQDRGRELALDLAGWADCVVQNFRPGVMERLGLGYAAMRERNPGVIYASLTAYGTTGALAHQPGMDVAVQARSGVMSITGENGSGPVKPGASLADFSGGAHLLVALLAALLHRERTGEGQELGVSLLDATAIMLANYSVAVLDGDAEIGPMGSGHPQLVPFQAFPTADGHVVIATGTNKLFRHLCRVLDREDLADDPRFSTNPERVRHRDALVGTLSAVLAERTTAEWIASFEAEEIPCAPVHTLREAFTDEQLVANDMVLAVEHPDVGTLHQIGIPYKFGATPCRIDRPPPRLGEHSGEVLAETLGIEAAELDALRRDGVI
jgi:crotonobetainyl-CoA:carnitine CoA-transferase CaiB-like acyl-CoA transferase